MSKSQDLTPKQPLTHKRLIVLNLELFLPLFFLDIQYSLFIYVMDRVYHVPKDEIGRMIADLIDMPGIEVIQEVDFNTALACWPDPIPDFGDAVIASIGKTIKGSAIVTFDREFADNLRSLGLRSHPL